MVIKIVTPVGRLLFLSPLGRLLVGIALVIAVASFISGGMPTAAPVAAKSGGTLSVAGKTGGTSGTSSLGLVLLNSTDGLPHWGQSVTFKVATTATNYPYVSLDCYQNGLLVYGAMAGFFPSYPWPGSQIFPLSSPSWTGGGANCRATLYYVNGKKNVTLTTLSFQAYA